ncbi:carbohydrate ABC transporter permease [Nonomuraea fuscirosea]|jgi:multiple sugar transport system permease protein|uniref:Carbohydrate ABC transporter membrane protein 2 (CUT1 family) n=1 Tax=Nonomuraea fuscirosea TaxID=1291556 RepID=A0A2T0N5Y6_9ACTN|nr:carbohydrate ABC transporter permease [Nonomuraea fuscirosea]PRX67760.1 carbohydrate ABC transporter membrane protein 2 (CUT1 family) [Nonomuraea fuscirosea]WSA57210.1 carbohydrate ABC transporter permease [Nonomuraea fuscirosea]
MRTSYAGRAVAFTVLALFSLLMLAPFLWAVNTSFKTEADAGANPVTIVPAGGYTWDIYANLFRLGSIPTWMVNSVLVAAAVTLITLVISTLAGYAFSRLDFTGRRTLLGLTVASIMIPGTIFIVPLFDEMLAFNMVDTYWGIILPQVVAPVMVFILKRFFDSIPRELEEAARVDGAGSLRIFLRIVLPLSRPIIAAVAIFTFVGAWNNFLWPFIVTNDPDLMTLPVGLETVSTGFGVVFAENMAKSVLAALPLIVVFLFFQRQIIKGIATTGLGGQ